ncbi:MAG TPA: GNAT family N-acetyltransferase [Anaerolineaceae bacterium]|nr:GNAT family N-acetyltransferase [Anaerolineaceae bacterium]
MAKIEILPLTPERWTDFEKLFLSNATCSGCWCMWWRIKNKEFNTLGKDGLKEAMRTIVHRGVEAGLIAYVDGFPAGWVTVAPRADYIRFETSRFFYPVDDQPVWSIPCFFVHHDYRHQGLMIKLIEAAEQYAKIHGADIVESYPYETDKKTGSADIFTGVSTTFKSAGYVEVARRKPTRPIMRKKI